MRNREPSHVLRFGFGKGIFGNSRRKPKGLHCRSFIKKLNLQNEQVYLVDLPIIRFEDLQERTRREVEEMCFICSANYVSDDVVSQLSRCGHVFHSECVGKLIQRKQHDCPFCRSSFFSGSLAIPCKPL
ncbi:RING-H2 finger protein ATL18 [Artemisia annua]|uniref:RING-H2 finger protein ATL18 n=1 Tax=Artemisia annua TaxID=35608 RepID=A0A2U1KT64_ARTAN|nr:RING-H2 finger protein ATL18 [Artemisia annua]